MKIRQKLLFGFMGTSLLVGVTGCIALIKITEIKYDAEQVNQYSIKGVAYSTKMHLVLESIQACAQEMLVEKSVVVLNPNHRAEAEEEVKETLRIIQDELNNFENNLTYAKKTTETAIELAKKTISTQEKQEGENKNNDLKILGQL